MGLFSSSWNFLSIFKIDVLLIYNVLVSAVQQSGSYIHTHEFLFIFFSIMVYHSTMNIIPCSIQ